MDWLFAWLWNPKSETTKANTSKTKRTLLNLETFEDRNLPGSIITYADWLAPLNWAEFQGVPSQTPEGGSSSGPTGVGGFGHLDPILINWIATGEGSPPDYTSPIPLDPNIPPDENALPPLIEDWLGEPSDSLNVFLEPPAHVTPPERPVAPSGDNTFWSPPLAGSSGGSGSGSGGNSGESGEGNFSGGIPESGGSTNPPTGSTPDGGTTTVGSPGQGPWGDANVQEIEETGTYTRHVLFTGDGVNSSFHVELTVTGSFSRTRDDASVQTESLTVTRDAWVEHDGEFEFFGNGTTTYTDSI
jgi:hypothetical protein